MLASSGPGPGSCWAPAVPKTRDERPPPCPHVGAAVPGWSGGGRRGARVCAPRCSLSTEPLHTTSRARGAGQAQGCPAAGGAQLCRGLRPTSSHLRCRPGPVTGSWEPPEPQHRLPRVAKELEDVRSRPVAGPGRGPSQPRSSPSRRAWANLHPAGEGPGALQARRAGPCRRDVGSSGQDRGEAGPEDMRPPFVRRPESLALCRRSGCVAVSPRCPPLSFFDGVTDGKWPSGDPGRSRRCSSCGVFVKKKQRMECVNPREQAWPNVPTGPLQRGFRCRATCCSGRDMGDPGHKQCS